MDLQISVFLLFLLFTAGQSLDCYKCSSMLGSCLSQSEKTCPSGSSCMSSTVVRKNGDVNDFTSKQKDCMANCADWSINLGITRTSVYCCDKDKCNVRDAQDPGTATPNGHTCYYCDDKSCWNKVSCSGNQDHCIKATVTYAGYSRAVKGCTTKSICDGNAPAEILTDVSCCEGNLCNGAESVSQSFLFLCCSLLSFIILH